ncbi:unnamed protein product [Allacma fusca]|uniref:BACK domain-containing protein n=1 Tax=Allacma fusca TaxID=39272 RepID=A0A8J2L593_9HEXA|nr:unnamed protein product [Allacma fusca]
MELIIMELCFAIGAYKQPIMAKGPLRRPLSDLTIQTCAEPCDDVQEMLRGQFDAHYHYHAQELEETFVGLLVKTARDQNILEEQAPMEKPPRIRKIVVCPIPRRLANLNSPRQGVCTSPKLQPVTIDSSDSENEWAFPERYGPRIERKKCKTLSVPCKKQGEPRNSETKGILKKFRSRTTQWKKMLEWEFWNTSEEDTKNVQRALPGKSLKVQLIDLVTATKIRSALNAGDHPAKVAHNLENRTKIRSALNGGDGSAEVPPNLEKNPSKNEKTSKKVKAVQRKRKKSKKSKGIEVKVTVKKGYGWAQCLLRILDHSLRTNNETMRLKTLDYIAPVTYLLLNTEEFFRLSPAGLKLILARDDLMIACELDLFNAVTSWGLYNCYGRNHRGFIGPGHYYDVMLEILKGPLNLARFSHLTNYNLLFKAIPFLHTSYDSLQNRLAWFKGMLRHSKG